MGRIGAVTAAVCWGAGLICPAMAGADPAPDLGVLHPVDAGRYATYSTYGAGGWQFAAPSGVRCRIMTVTRWMSPSQATCWGPALPGVSPGIDYAKATASWSNAPAGSVFGHAELDDFETYRSYEHRSGDVVDHVDPASYIPLNAGEKLTVEGTNSAVTCGVPGPNELTCTVTGTGPESYLTGFVLSPAGSRTF